MYVYIPYCLKATYSGQIQVRLPLKLIAELTVMKEPRKSQFFLVLNASSNLSKLKARLREKPHIPLSKDHIRFESAKQAQRWLAYPLSPTPFDACYAG